MHYIGSAVIQRDLNEGAYHLKSHRWGEGRGRADTFDLALILKCVPCMLSEPFIYFYVLHSIYPSKDNSITFEQPCSGTARIYFYTNRQLHVVEL